MSNIPEYVLDLSNRCKKHGISFSQGESCIYISKAKYNNKQGWKISDGYGRKVFSSIFCLSDGKTFFVIDVNNNVLEYISKESVLKHASQFFIKDIHKTLTF